MKKFIMLAAMVGFAGSAAHAQDASMAPVARHEIGIGFTGGDVALAHARYGYNLNKNFRVEAEAASGSVISNGSGFIFSDDDINYWASAFGVARLPYGANNSAVFVRAGVGRSETVAQAFTSHTGLYGPNNTAYPELTANGTVLQAGLGVEHFFTRRFGVRADATYANDSSFDDISDAPGREPRDSGYATVGVSAVVRF